MHGGLRGDGRLWKPVRPRSASAVSLKLFQCVHNTPLPPLSAANCSFEPTCHSAGRSTAMWFQTSLQWANVRAACPCSAYCLGTQTGHTQDNPIVPRCVPHGSLLSGFADGGLSGVLPPDLLTWWQPGGFVNSSRCTSTAASVTTRWTRLALAQLAPFRSLRLWMATGDLCAFAIAPNIR